MPNGENQNQDDSAGKIAVVVRIHGVLIFDSLNPHCVYWPSNLLGEGSIQWYY